MSAVPSSTAAAPGSDAEEDGGPFKQTLRFAYRHSATLAIISVAWVVLSLPLVTAGPATLGAYRAILSLREGELSVDAVVATVRGNLLASALLGLVPPVFVAVGALYLLSPGGSLGSVAIALGLAASYLGLYFGVLLIPTYYRIASGDDPVHALRTGYVCMAGAPRLTLRLVAVTGILLVASALLTVALVVVFPAFTMSYHVAVIEPELAASTGDGSDR